MLKKYLRMKDLDHQLMFCVCNKHGDAIVGMNLFYISKEDGMLHLCPGVNAEMAEQSGIKLENGHIQMMGDF